MTSDGRGQASLTPTPAIFDLNSAIITLNFVLISKTHGYVVEFDNNGCGSGTLDLQTTVSQSNLAGSYVVSLVGEYLKDIDPLVIAGAFTLDASGNITAGIQDGVGTPPVIIATYIAQPLSGSLLIGSGNSPGKATLDGILPLPFDVYPIDATHLKLIGTAEEVFIGEAFREQTDVPSGSQVFTLTGSDAAFSNMNVGGLMTFDGNGSVIAGLEDLDDTGNISLSMPFFGSYSALDSNGRAEMTLTGFSPDLQSIGLNTTTRFVLYPSTGGLVILEIDGIADLMGPAIVQTNPSLPTNQPFGMSLSGWNSSGDFSDTAQFTTGSAGTGFSGLIDSNTFGRSDGPWTQTSGQTLTGTYSFDSATGRGSISSNSSPDLEFYLIDDTSAVFIGISGEQQAQGSFAGQTLSGTKSSMFAVPGFSVARMPASQSAGFRGASRRKTPSLH